MSLPWIGSLCPHGTTISLPQAMLSILENMLEKSSVSISWWRDLVRVHIKFMLLVTVLEATWWVILVDQSRKLAKLEWSPGWQVPCLNITTTYLSWQPTKQILIILALDPAKPWFDLTDEANKVSKNDATFVDVVHTNSGFLLDGRLSLTEALGHMDFYPNGGSHQPGCNDMCLIANWCFEFNLWDLFKSKMRM